MWNKKSALMLAALSLLLGGAGVIGLQARAQQPPALTTPPAQMQTQSAKDNGLPESAVGQESGKEAKGSVEADENLPGGGHQDQGGTNVDHQFEGIE